MGFTLFKDGLLGALSAGALFAIYVAIDNACRRGRAKERDEKLPSGPTVTGGAHLIGRLPDAKSVAPAKGQEPYTMIISASDSSLTVIDETREYRVPLGSKITATVAPGGDRWRIGLIEPI